MKKLILGAAMMIGFISFSIAQTVAPAPAKMAPKKVTTTKSVTTVTPAPKPAMVKKPATTTTTTVVAKPAAKPVVATPAKPAKTQGVVLKKDGTPDKRFNNAAAKDKGPVKKDGTPDKRYKANKN